MFYGFERSTDSVDFMGRTPYNYFAAPRSAVFFCPGPGISSEEKNFSSERPGNFFPATRPLLPRKLNFHGRNLETSSEGIKFPWEGTRNFLPGNSTFPAANWSMRRCAVQDPDFARIQMKMKSYTNPSPGKRFSEASQ